MGRVARAGKILNGRRSLPPVPFHLALEIITLHTVIPAIDHIHQIVQSHDQIKGRVGAVDDRGEMTGTRLAEWFQKFALRNRIAGPRSAPRRQ